MSYSITPILVALLVFPSFSNIPPPSAIPAIVSFVKDRYDPGLIQAAGGHILEEFDTMEMANALLPTSALASLAQSPAIEFIEIDGRFEIAQASTSEYSESWALVDIGAEPVHSLDYTGRGVKIALLDTGIDYNHPELARNYRGGYDFINNDNDPMDDNGHGTHVAGILAAAKDGKGIVGIAPEAEIYAIKVSDKRGSGSFSDLAKGINWAIENDIDIVTMSITGDGGSRALAKAVQTAYDEYGMVMVAAVGNGEGDVLYPAAYEQVIGVGSVTKENKLSDFSRTGDQVELVAPGSRIKSTAMGGGYRLSSGTSMATPLVAGAVALLLGSDETAWSKTGIANGDGVWTNNELREVLRDTAKDLGKEGKDDSFGYGLLNLDFLATSQSDTVVAAASPAEKTNDDISAHVVKSGWFFPFRLALSFQPVI
ncbi:MAG TPA: S8 family peptidase [Nitrososphaera sp.]